MLNTKRILSTTLAACAALVAFGQSATDYPNLKANGQRTGVNGNVAGSSPGYLSVQTTSTTSSLRWLRPQISSPSLNALFLNEINPLKTVIDNTDDGLPTHLDDAGNNVGPYDPLFQGIVSQTGTWNIPTLDQSANGSYVLPIRRVANPANPAAFQARNNRNRFPEHKWAGTVAQAADSNDPRVAAVPANLRTFEWSFSPAFSTFAAGVYTPQDDPVPKNYGIYVWIPQNFVQNGAANVYSQRYYVYEITYGSGQRYIDVVDTDVAGSGWVRLGNGGRATSQIFPYAGINPGTGRPYPLSVRLYNTVPRGSDGNFRQQLLNGQSPNDFAVYADAVLFQQELGSHFATPTSAGFGGADIRVTGVQNRVEFDPLTNTGLFTAPRTFSTGTVRSHDFNTGNERWQYTPAVESENAINLDNNSPRYTASGGFAPATDAPSFRGTNYLKAAVTGVTATENVTIDPDQSLPDGSYEIYTYLSGNPAGPTPNPDFATAAQYSIIENGVTVANVVVNQATTSGWVRLGNRRFRHSSAARLQVIAFNSSTVAGDIGKSVMVDAVRFVGTAGNDITSTPVHARAFVRDASTADPVERNVVLIADERGRIHCLDADGNGNGTTRVYWTYPSTRDTDSATWRDPNLDPRNDTSGIAPNQKFDGQRDDVADPDQVLAEMPTGFDLSTALVKRLTFTRPDLTTYQRDFLIIGAENGRVYSIAMEGRGDNTTGTNKPGTTFRTWTWPQTFPAQDRNLSLGKITSVTTGAFNILSPTPTDLIFVGTESGRMYAINSRGDFDYSGNSRLRTDALNSGPDDNIDDPVWQYPAADQPTVGAILGAPAVDVPNNRIFFGTEAVDDTPGAIYSLNALNGSVNWSYQGGGGAPQAPQTWAGGLGYVPAAELNAVTPLPGGVASPNSLFGLNQNGYVYAFNADNGSVLWTTNELQSGGRGSIGFTRITTFDTGQVLRQFPVITVTTASGRLATLFARTGDVGRFGNRRAWGANVEGGVTASLTTSNRWMFGASESGFLFAFSDLVNAGGTLPIDFGSPITEELVDNNPAGDAYRNAEVALISKSAYDQLRRTQAGGLTGLQDYADVIDAGATFTRPNGRVQPAFKSLKPDNTQPAFEWGENIHLIIYNFPFDSVDGGGREVAPPQAKVTLTTPGKVGRPNVSEAKLWRDRTPGTPNSGYAVVEIPLTESGQNSQPPGEGTLNVTIDTRTLGGLRNGLDVPVNPNTGQMTYRIANPLAVQMWQPNNAGILQRFLDERFGVTVDPTDPQTQNGSFDVPGLNGSRLLSSTSVVGHGQTTKARIDVFDRSLIAVGRGPGRGLSNVRIERRDLEWMGGAGSVRKPFSSLAPIVGPTLAGRLSTFEDLPTLFPNLSLDYPNIRREQIRVRKDGSGFSENPVAQGVTLQPPTVNGAPLVNYADALNRTLVPTTFELNVDVPRYQPSGLPVSIPDANNRNRGLGYLARYNVYVDTNGGNVRGVNASAFRTFSLGTLVGADERITVNTPTVDLGSLASGTGYDSTLDYTQANRGLNPLAAFSPYGGAYVNVFKPFSVLNEGNVNLLNVRLAKGSVVAGPTLFPWQINSTTNDDSVWLDASRDVWSDIDSTFAPRIGGVNMPIIVQKPRVGDLVGRNLRVNPRSRLNINVPTSGQLLDPTNLGGERDPRIAVSLPFGTPVGKYSQTMRVIEDSQSFFGGFGDELLTLGPSANGGLDGLEAYSDPTFRLDFTVKETRLTGGFGFVGRAANGSPVGANRLIDSNVVNPATEATNPTQWSNVQPGAARLRNGSLIVAYSSNRPLWNPIDGKAPGSVDTWRIYLATMAGSRPTNAGPASSTITNNLRDLQGFRPPVANGDTQWFRQSTVSPFPNVAPDTLFTPVLQNGVANALEVGGTVDPASVRFTQPTFSNRGSELGTIEPATANLDTNRLFMTFVGSCFRNTATGRVVDSRLFVVPVDVDNDGNITMGRIFSLDADPQAVKSKPSITVVPNGLRIAYTSTQNGVSSIMYTDFTVSTNPFTAPQMLPFGSAFESVSDPSITSRLSLSPAFAQVRNGTAPTINGAAQVNVTDVAFVGKLRSRRAGSVFIGRMEMARTGQGPYDPTTDGLRRSPFWPWTPFERQVNEKLVFDAQTGVWTTRGVQWTTNPWVADANGNFPYVIRTAGGIPVIDPAVAPTFDRETGLVSHASRFGGRIIIDPSAGTVRLTGTTLGRSIDLRIDYQPLFLRVSGSDVASYTSTNLLFDNRLGAGNFTNGSVVSPTAFWFNNNNQVAAAGPNDRSDRYIVAAVRNAVAGGQTARPFMSTLRFGVRLGFALRTRENGLLIDNVRVTRADGSPIVGNYQVDPSAGRIYFTRLDEGRSVRIVINNNTANTIVTDVSVIGERTEEPILLDKAVNENGLTMFLDPSYLQYQDLANFDGRRSLIWMLWSSTRNGAPDLYLQSLAPKLIPFVPTP